MIRTIGAKLLHLVPVLLLVSIATFLMIDLIPGDPALAIAGPDASDERIAEIRDSLNLDRPVFERYFDWMGSAVTGDLGNGLVPPVQPVSEMVQQRLPVTLQIALMALTMSFLIAIPVALRSAYRPDAVFDRFATAGAFASISIPSFLASLLLIFLFVFHRGIIQALLLSGVVIGTVSLGVSTASRARHYPLGSDRSRFVTSRIALGVAALAIGVVVLFAFPSFPRTGFVRLTSEEGLRENLRHAFLPALALASSESAIFMRLLRSDLVETLGEDFILAARAKGMPAWRILYRDALRPSSFSLITVAGVAAGRAIGGTVIVETIFGLPGMGTMVISAINARNYPVVQGGVLVIAVFYVLINAVVDLSYAYLDPRVRRSHG